MMLSSTMRMWRSSGVSGGAESVEVDGVEAAKEDGVIKCESKVEAELATTIAARVDGRETVRVSMKNRKTDISAVKGFSLTTSLPKLTLHFYPTTKHFGDFYGA